MSTIDRRKVKKYYDKDPEHEWSRLERWPFEFPVTMHILHRYLKHPTKVVDIGGGPGRYSIELSSEGHNVTLVDLSEVNIEFAKEKAKERGVVLSSTLVGDAVNLKDLGDSAFDVVLNLGPFYHLSDEKDRRSAAAESVRVLKPGGILVVAFISCFAYAYDVAGRWPSEVGELRATMARYIESGLHIESVNEPGFTDAYFVDPSTIVPFWNGFGVEAITLFGAEGMTAQSQLRFIELGETVVGQWIEFAKETAETQAAVYGSGHVVFVGRKK